MDRCLNRCTFCPGKVKETGTLNERFDRFKEAADHFLDQEFKQIEISGNDPIQFPMIREAVEYLKSNGVEYLTISTHARNLKDGNLAKDLAGAGVNFLRVPLYGATAQTHNKVVQFTAPDDEMSFSKGNAFEETVLGIKNAVANNIVISGHTIPMKYNQDELAEIIDLYLKLSNGKMNSMIIAAAGISAREYEYTSDWYLPIHKTGEILKPLLNHSITRDFPQIKFHFEDFPACALYSLNPRIVNQEIVPNIGTNEIVEEMRSKHDEKIPHYRVKTHFDKCDVCVLKKACGGILKNDYELFGADDLKPITAEAMMDPNIRD